MSSIHFTLPKLKSYSTNITYPNLNTQTQNASQANGRSLSTIFSSTRDQLKIKYVNKSPNYFLQLYRSANISKQVLKQETIEEYFAKQRKLFEKDNVLQKAVSKMKRKQTPSSHLKLNLQETQYSSFEPNKISKTIPSSHKSYKLAYE